MSKQTQRRQDTAYRYLRDAPHKASATVLYHDLSRLDQHTDGRRGSFFTLTTDRGVSHHHLLSSALRHHWCNVDIVYRIGDEILMHRAFDLSSARNGVIRTTSALPEAQS